MIASTRIFPKITMFGSNSRPSLWRSHYVWELLFTFPVVMFELHDVITWCMYTVMIFLLICRHMCATIPGAHIRCMHSILSFNWSVTFMLILLHHAKCIASFVCIGSYIIDLWSRLYRYSIKGAPHLLGCASRSHFALHWYTIMEYIEVICVCYYKALSSSYVPNWKSLILCWNYILFIL
jgi:hypothetical protein